MPVYWFALSQVESIHTRNAVIIFVVLHLLVYPASNGYNSYMDRDTESIGGVRSPQQPTKQLFYATILMDLIAVLISFFISSLFAGGILAYILASRAYSYRGIRLKKYPVTGYLTVIIFQGAVTFFLVKYGSSTHRSINVSLTALIASSLLIGSFYPLSQIYQHRQDKEDGITTLSYKLGYRGTFIFSAIIYSLASLMLCLYLCGKNDMGGFIILQLFLLPVTVYFFWWFYQVWKDNTQANFTNTMRMNLVASICTNGAFLLLLINNKF